MRKRNRVLAFALVLPLAAGAGCARLQAKQAFRDGNKAYREENYKKAIEYYQRAVEHDPLMAEAYFYLGSSHQALFRPGRETADNQQLLDDARTLFEKSLEVNDGSTPNREQVKRSTLAALTGIYSDIPFRNFDTAYRYADQLVQQDPNDLKNIFAMANLYEKFEKVEQAEAMYQRAVEVAPDDPKACAAQAAFFNKPYWEGQSQFDKAIDTLKRCAELAPEDPAGHYKVAVFYWDKSYRDPDLTDEVKDQYADSGIEAVQRALAIKPDYVEALVYKGLLLRVKAQVTRDPRTRAQFLDQATTISEQVKDMRAQQQREAEEAARLGLATEG